MCEHAMWVASAARDLPRAAERIEMNVYTGFVSALSDLRSDLEHVGCEISDLYDLEYQLKYADVMEDVYTEGALGILANSFTCDEAFAVMDELQEMLHQVYGDCFKRGAEKFYRLYPQWAAEKDSNDLRNE